MDIGDGDARGQGKRRAADATTVAADAVVIQISAIRAAVGAAANVTSRGVDAHHISAADDTGKGIVAVGISGGGVEITGGLVGGGDDQQAAERRFAVVLTVVVQILPDAVAQRQFVEAKVDGLIAIGIGAGLDWVVAFVAFPGRLGAGGQADDAARHNATRLAQAVEGGAVILVVTSGVAGVGVLAAAVHIAVEQAAHDKVGVGNDDEVARGSAEARRQIGKGIVAATGEGAGNAAVTGAKEAVAVAILIEFDDHAVGHILFTTGDTAVVVGVVPDAVAQADFGRDGDQVIFHFAITGGAIGAKIKVRTEAEAGAQQLAGVGVDRHVHGQENGLHTRLTTDRLCHRLTGAKAAIAVPVDKAIEDSAAAGGVDHANGDGGALTRGEGREGDAIFVVGRAGNVIAGGGGVGLAVGFVINQAAEIEAIGDEMAGANGAGDVGVVVGRCGGAAAAAVRVG